MSSTAYPLDIKLRDFLKSTFLKGRTKVDRGRYVTFHNRLKIQLGRDPLLSDLTAEAFESFREWMRPRWSLSSYERSASAWRRIVEYMLDAGIPIETPADRRKTLGGHRGRQRMPWIVPPLTPGEHPVTIRQLFNHCFMPLRMRGRSKKTIERYRSAIDAFHQYLGREPLLADLQDDLVAAFLYSIVERGCSAVHANSHRNNLLSLWRFGARKRHCEEFPEVAPLVEPVRIPKARSREELDTLWAALDALLGRVGKVPARLWWRALHFVAFFTAERIGSILQILWSDVNLQTGWLVCRAETRKFGAADKATRLPREAIESLRAIIEPERKLIFEWPMTGSSLYLHYKRILRRAGLSTDRKSKFHMLRRSAASHFKAAGGDPQALLGHSSLKTTAGYIDPRICPPPQAADLLFVPGGAE